MNTLNELVTAYNKEQAQIEALNEQLEQAKHVKHQLAEQIKTDFGVGPHEIDGKKLVVGTVKGTSFLRAPLKPPTRKKADESPKNDASA